jgi:hypothetical protein
MNAIVLLGIAWLLGAGLLAPLLVSRRRHGQDRRSTSFEHLRASSTYRRAPHRNNRRIVFHAWGTEGRS